MKLVSIPEWSAKYFDESSRPDDMKCRRWLRDGKLPGRKVGGTWFIDLDAWQLESNEFDTDQLVNRVLGSN